MALVNRISRLFTADFHAVLDRIEEPEQLLKQAIRDMEDELVAAQQRISVCSHEQDGIGARRAELNEKLTEIEDELDLCFGSKKHSLARSLIRKKLEGQRFLKRLETKLAENEAYLGKTQAQLTKDQTTLDGLTQKAELFAQHRPNDRESPADDIAWVASGLAVSEDEIEVAFLREQQARSAS